MILKETKDGLFYYDEPRHFLFKEQWDDFIATLDMSDEKIKILVEEVEFLRKEVAEYYLREVDATL